MASILTHRLPLSSLEALPVGLSVNDTVPISHPIPLSLSQVTPVGLSVRDTVPVNHSHILQAALTPGFDIDVSDSKHLLTGDQAKLLSTDMAAAAKEWMDHLNNPHHVAINILINITDDDKNHPRFDGGPAF